MERSCLPWVLLVLMVILGCQASPSARHPFLSCLVLLLSVATAGVCGSTWHRCPYRS